MTSTHKELKAESKRRAEARVSRATRACGGGAMREVADAAVHKHERHDHPGEKPTHFVKGGAAKKRLDRQPRAKGGRVKGKTEVNIIVSPGGPTPAMAAPAPMPVPPRPMPAPAMARPPMAPPPMGAGMPPGGLQPAAMGAGMPMRKRGGRTEMTAGAGSGIGRLEKAAAFGARK